MQKETIFSGRLLSKVVESWNIGCGIDVGQFREGGCRKGKKKTRLQKPRYICERNKGYKLILFIFANCSSLLVFFFN